MTVKQFLHERPGLEMKTQFDSLVQRAFRGELVPTEAELAQREGRSYEPASALLAKKKHKGEMLNRRGNGRWQKRHKNNDQV